MSDYSSRFNECEAVPVKVDRVFDSCSDKDCIEGVAVTLPEPLPDTATIVKARCVTVTDACINTEPIPFNKGFYSVDITFNMEVQLLAYDTACGTPTPITGTAAVSKNCILYGSETNSRTFSSSGSNSGELSSCSCTDNPPTALVQAVSPIVLDAKISNGCNCCCPTPDAPEQQRNVLLTIGLFYVVELTRPATIMVPAYNYTIPQKNCCAGTETPCEIFDKLQFPTEEFSPSKLETGCGCDMPIQTLSNSEQM